jgi:hypothetical protein
MDECAWGRFSAEHAVRGGKSAMRIVALYRLVKESRRQIRIFSEPRLRRIHSKWTFFTYAFSVEYVLGFDGGGTKTECVLMDSAGVVVARSIAGPSNPTRVGVEAATGEIERAAELVLREAGVARSSVVALGAGLAGTAQAEMKERMRRRWSVRSRNRREAFYGFGGSVGGDRRGPAIVLVAGTGSAAIARDEKENLARRGYGHRSAMRSATTSAAGRGEAMKEREEQGAE